MLVFPNCKINLGLSIVEKRKDGFHNIETIFHPVPLSDVLEIIPAVDGETTFSSSGIPIPDPAAQNLCIKAYNLLNEDFDLGTVKMHLHKTIPMGAGLGGGSSDAAHTLTLLNELFELKLSQTQLLDYASVLGADCPFFILNETVFAFERGDKFKKLKVDLERYMIVIVKPEVHVGTVEAYAGVKPEPKTIPLNRIIEIPIHKWKENLKNDFEENIFFKHPEIEKIKNKLYENGATYASMSGSGSSVFGLFEKPLDLSQEFEDCFYWSSKI